MKQSPQGEVQSMCRMGGKVFRGVTGWRESEGAARSEACGRSQCSCELA